MFLAVLALISATTSHAMDLDWSGQFRAEAHWVKNYNLDNGLIPGTDPRNTSGGYYIPGGGSDSAHFQTLFMRLRPKLIVNDNVYIKSEFWLGNPIFGFYGDSAPFNRDERQYYSTQSRGSSITAQRFWAEFLTDVGTVQVGRAPLDWGLGIVWRAGDGLFDRYQSTGDVVRLISKFGSFSFIPSVVKYSLGNNIGGAYNQVAGGSAQGGGGVSDYSLEFKYENPDEDFEGGVNFIKRIAGAAQFAGDPNSGFLGVGNNAGTNAAQAPSGVNYNTWDLYGKKKFGKITLAAELPITSGDIAGLEYKTFAAALEGKVDWTDSWETNVRAGHAPGQPNISGASTDKYRAFYFNPNYKLGLIMFNYQLRNFAGPNSQNNPGTAAASLSSPYDNPIVNANYLNVGGAYKTDKWRFKANYIVAGAREAAAGTQGFFNTWDHRYVGKAAAAPDQKTSLGWEMDYGLEFHWDEGFVLGADAGWFFPGEFYKFSNTATENNTNSVFATVFRAGVNF